MVLLHGRSETIQGRYADQARSPDLPDPWRIYGVIWYRGMANGILDKAIGILYLI